MNGLFPVPSTLAKAAHADAARYRAMYAQSVADPESFWAEIAQGFEWMAPWTRVKNTSFVDDVRIRWFEDAKLNITVNCLDRHAVTQPDKLAIIWEGDTPGEVRRITYRELLADVCRAANALKALGVKKGDRVTLYMPMVPEAAVAMLACARIGAVHSVVFGGFSSDSIRDRIVDCTSDVVITANMGRRGGKAIPLKANVDKAITGLNVRHVLTLKVTEDAVPMQEGRDVWWHDVVPQQSAACAPEAVVGAAAAPPWAAGAVVGAVEAAGALGEPAQAATTKPTTSRANNASDLVRGIVSPPSKTQDDHQRSRLMLTPHERAVKSRTA